MRLLCLLALFSALEVAAQTARPELAVVFVGDNDARPMTGAYAMPIAAQAWLSTPNTPAWTVEMHFTVSKDYPYSEHEISTHKSWPLSGDTVRVGRREHLRFNILDCFCTDQYLLVIQAGDTMRVDMPNDDTNRGHLIHLMVARSGAVPSPEVVRFRPGRFSFVALAEDPNYREVEARIAQRLIRDARKHAKRNPPSAPEPALREPKRKQDREAARPAEEPEQVKSAGQAKAKLVAMRDDTAVVRLSGRLMMDGGCASAVPMMAMEFRGAPPHAVGANGLRTARG